MRSLKRLSPSVEANSGERSSLACQYSSKRSVSALRLASTEVGCAGVAAGGWAGSAGAKASSKDAAINRAGSGNLFKGAVLGEKTCLSLSLEQWGREDRKSTRLNS